MAGYLTPQQEAELWARLQADPNFQRVANASYASPMLRDSAIQNYVRNDPRSPFYGAAKTPQTGRGVGSYRVHTNEESTPTGGFAWDQIIPESRWQDPSFVGPLAVGTVAGLGLGGVIPAGPAAAARGAAATAAAGTPGYVPASMIGTGVPTGLTLPPALAGTPGYVPPSVIGRDVPTGITTPPGAGADYLGPKPSRDGPARPPAEGASRLPPWQQALLGLANLPAALIASRQNRPTAEEQATQQQIQQMLAQQQRRTTTQDPLFEAVTRLAMNRLPTNVQQPIERL